MDQIEQLFYQEVSEMLEEAAFMLVEAEVQGTVEETVPALFRMFHSIKGSAQMVEMDELSRLSHQLESILDDVRNGKRLFERPLINLTLEVIEAIEGDIACRRRSDHCRSGAESYESLMNKVRQLSKSGVTEAVAVPTVQEAAAEPQATVILPPVPAARWVQLDFWLDGQEELMPEVTKLLLEMRYAEAGSIVASTLQGLAIRLLLNTDWDDARLINWSTSTDVQRIVCHELLQAANGTDAPAITLEQMERGHQLFGELHQRLQTGTAKDINSAFAKLRAWLKKLELPETCRRREVLLAECLLLLPALLAKDESRLLYLRLLRHLWESVYEQVENRCFYWSVPLNGPAAVNAWRSSVADATTNAMMKHCIADLSVWPLEADFDEVRTLRQWLHERGVDLHLWEGEGRLHYLSDGVLDTASSTKRIWQSSYDACFGAMNNKEAKRDDGIANHRRG